LCTIPHIFDADIGIQGFNVTWSKFWNERAANAARRRKRVYGLDPPPRISRLIASKEPTIGASGSLLITSYVLFGSPRALLRLLWNHLVDRDTPKRVRKIAFLAHELRGQLSDSCRIAAGYFERRVFSRDLARMPRALEKLFYRTTPLLVVQPRDEADIAALMDFAREKRLAVTPRGVSSSAFGGAVPTQNGIVVDLSAMRDILHIDPTKATARVQAGVRWADLASRLREFGLVPMTTPSSRFSTVGGWAATGGLGIDGFRYGHFSRAIVAARVVSPDSTVTELSGDDDRIRDFIGTEGQFGIITELTLRLRPQPGYSSPRLVCFDDSDSALAFVHRMIADDMRPSHAVFYDRARMKEENLLFKSRTSLTDPIVQERDTVLLHFDDPDLEGECVSKMNLASDDGPAARYLWSERFFPLKAQRLGPNLLACEVVLPDQAVGRFVARGRRLAVRFGVEVAVEANVYRSDKDGRCVVIASFLCDTRRPVNYLLRLLLVQLLMRVGVRLGGKPYGFGIWNSAFLDREYPAQVLRNLTGRKKEADPYGLLNPRKFFGVRTRFFNLPGLFFAPSVFKASLDLGLVLSPVLGMAARMSAPAFEPGWRVPDPEEQGGRRLLIESALRCTHCGACISVCPAYLLTNDELVTGRSKLRLAETLADRGEVRAHEAASPFQCLRCGLCEEVCQTRLPLRDCYLVLERWIEDRFGWPGETIEAFLQTVDENRDWIESTFGLDLPQWTPAKGAVRGGSPQPTGELGENP